MAMPRTEQPGSTSQQERAARRQIAALRVSITSFALLGGLACYILLTQLGVPALAAGTIGLVFALLTRLAITALVGEWLHAAASRLHSPDGQRMRRRDPRR